MTLIKDIDYGTPIPATATTVCLTIDGRPVTVPAGTSIMAAAMTVGIEIPRLCATDTLRSFGGCRLCLVEIEGRRGTPSSCTTPAEDGQVVRTRTERLLQLRRGVMELYLSDHPPDCLTCAANGDCELQTMAAAVGLREVRYGSDGANHLAESKDVSNPYFDFDPAKCIVCHRCVRACEEIQGAFALTVVGHGFGARIAPGGPDFLGSECVSCGACVQSCPTGALIEKTVVAQGTPDDARVTTCAYCGVGCSLVAETRGGQVVRMVPDKRGKANEGHACVKGRFAWGYATHSDRVTRPMVREGISDPWRAVSWEEAIGRAASEFTRIQAQYGRRALGAVTSSRCTCEEVFLVQKLVRAAFRNNNVDTCARVCHAPTGYGLKTAFGTSAGTQDFRSIAQADVLLLVGVNPTDGHPVVGARLKRRLRQGARLIVADPRRIDIIKSPHIGQVLHLPLRPGANVALVNALAHVIVTDGLVDQAFVGGRCDKEAYDAWAAFVAEARNSPEAVEPYTGVPAADVRAAARLYAEAGNAAIFYGLGVTEHTQGSTTVMGLANLAMATGNIGRPGVGVNPLRGQNNVQGSCDMGSFPNEFSGYRSVADEAVRRMFETAWGVSGLDDVPGLRISDMLDHAIGGTLKGMYIQGEDIAQSDPNTRHVTAGLRAMECVVVQDLFLNETSRFAHVFLPGASFLEKDGTFINGERRISRVRQVMAPLAGKAEWQVTSELAEALGYPMHYETPAQIMDEIARLTPAFADVSYARLEELGSVQWPCTAQAPAGTPIMHIDRFVRGSGNFVITEFVPTEERTGPRFPLILTTGRTLTQYNVGTMTRRTANMVWHDQDVLEIHPHDAEQRGIRSGDRIALASRMGEIVLKAVVSPRMQPGVVYTTFHHPGSGTNVITTERKDWATSCPEYKVTAVEVRLTNEAGDWRRLNQLEDGATSAVAGSEVAGIAGGAAPGP